MSGYETIGVDILAAGNSSRLGQPKQLVKYGGKPLLQKIMDTTKAFDFGFRLVVLGGNFEEISASIVPNGFVIIKNENWETGIGSSIRAGIEQLAKSAPAIRHVMILLSDQPFVNQDIIQKLGDLHLSQQKGITACQYAESVGVPAIFSKTYFQELIDLNGDQGAKKIILKAIKGVQLVDFPKGTIDIDTPEDLKWID